MSTPDYFESLSRPGAAAELPVELASELVEGTIRDSTALTLGKRVPTTTRDSRIPVLATRPVARWITTPDTGLGQTSTTVWANQTLVAEELMAICPVPRTIIEDETFNLTAAIQPLLTQAMATAVDDAVIWNLNKPSTYGPSVIEHATAAGNTVSGAVFADTTDNAGLVLQSATQVAQEGFNVSGVAVAPGWNFRVGSQRTAALVANPAGADQPYPLLLAGLGIHTDPLRWSPAVQARTDTTDIVVNAGSTVVADPAASATDLVGSYISGTGIPAGTEIVTVTPGTGYTISQAATATGTPALTIGRGSVDAIAGDWSKLLVGIRRDITIESFDSGIISNAAGVVELNLMQQDAIAFRITMRVGMLIVTPPGDRYVGPRSPFSLVLNSATAGPVGVKSPAKSSAKK